MIVIWFKRYAAHSPTVHHLVLSMGAGIRWAENSSFVKSNPHLAATLLHIIGHSVLS
jgi:hypothetical protein